MKMMRHAKFLRGVATFWRTRLGNAGAEFALVLPLLTVLLFGGLEIGRALHDYHVVAETVRDAARFLGRAPYTCSGSGSGCTTCNKATGACGTCSFDDAADIATAEALAMTGQKSGGSPLLSGWTDASTIDIEMCYINNSGGTYSGLYDGVGVVPHVRLKADVPFTFLFGELVAPDAVIDINLSHSVVAAGL